MPSIDQTSLSSVDDVVTNGMTSVETALNTELAATSSMTSMGVADMIQIQYDMANYTVAGQTLSAIMKDMSDTMKAVVQHIG